MEVGRMLFYHPDDDKLRITEDEPITAEEILYANNAFSPIFL
jgi:hypothetical protein